MQPDDAGDRASVDALVETSRELVQAGRYAEAIVACDRALAIDPACAMAWNNRGWAYFKVGRAEDAVASYAEALKLEPQHRHALLNRGLAFLELHRPADALTDYRAMTLVEPVASDHWVSVARCELDLGRPEAALAAADTAIRLNANDAMAWNNRGVALQRMQRVDEARAAFDRALELEPDHQLASANRRGIVHMPHDDGEQPATAAVSPTPPSRPGSAKPGDLALVAFVAVVAEALVASGVRLLYLAEPGRGTIAAANAVHWVLFLVPVLLGAIVFVCTLVAVGGGMVPKDAPRRGRTWLASAAATIVATALFAGASLYHVAISTSFFDKTRSLAEQYDRAESVASAAASALAAARQTARERAARGISEIAWPESAEQVAELPAGLRGAWDAGDARAGAHVLVVSDRKSLDRRYDWLPEGRRAPTAADAEFIVSIDSLGLVEHPTAYQVRTKNGIAVSKKKLMVGSARVEIFDVKSGRRVFRDFTGGVRRELVVREYPVSEPIDAWLGAKEQPKPDASNPSAAVSADAPWRHEPERRVLAWLRGLFAGRGATGMSEN